jgi:hypothetical protein
METFATPYLIGRGGEGLMSARSTTRGDSIWLGVWEERRAIAFMKVGLSAGRHSRFPSGRRRPDRLAHAAISKLARSASAETRVPDCPLVI